jgi:hypothetical protein
LSENLLHLCQVKQLWFQNLLSLLAHLHLTPRQILNLQIDLLHLQIDHHPHRQIQLEPDHLLHFHLILHLQNHLSLRQLVQAKLATQILFQQFDLLLE